VSDLLPRENHGHLIVSLMVSEMHMVRRPRRQRSGRMHYRIRRLQKGKGILTDALKFLGLDFLL